MIEEESNQRRDLVVALTATMSELTAKNKTLTETLWGTIKMLERFNESFSGSHAEKRGALKFIVDELRRRMMQIPPYDNSGSDSEIPF
jgi:hypothetical protein